MVIVKDQISFSCSDRRDRNGFLGDREAGTFTWLLGFCRPLEAEHLIALYPLQNHHLSRVTG
jgi:hypothetical protein